MSRFSGDLTDYGQTNSLFGKNIKAEYRAPKSEYEFTTNIVDFDSLSAQELEDLIPENWHDDNENDYWEEKIHYFWGKDGQTNAYVKRGSDNEEIEFFERQQTNKYTWHFATDDNHILFLGGGKIYARGREWFILKVISQDSTQTITNKYEAMDTDPRNERLLKHGLKILILV